MILSIYVEVDVSCGTLYDWFRVICSKWTRPIRFNFKGSAFSFFKTECASKGHRWKLKLIASFKSCGWIWWSYNLCRCRKDILYKNWLCITTKALLYNNVYIYRHASIASFIVNDLLTIRMKCCITISYLLVPYLALLFSVINNVKTVPCGDTVLQSAT